MTSELPAGAFVQVLFRWTPHVNAGGARELPLVAFQSRGMRGVTQAVLLDQALDVDARKRAAREEAAGEFASAVGHGCLLSLGAFIKAISGPSRR